MWLFVESGQESGLCLEVADLQTVGVSRQGRHTSRGIDCHEILVQH